MLWYILKAYPYLMIKMTKNRYIIPLLLFLVGCQSHPHYSGTQFDPSKEIICTSPRPIICTREFDPVCALKDNRQAMTYATGCVACSDTQVKLYIKGPCNIVKGNH